MKKGICCAGNMIVDITYPIETWPKQNELTHITEGIKQSTGGSVCNTISDLARLDPQLPLVASGFAGHDAEGDFVLQEMGKYKNIDLSMVKRNGRTSFTAVMSNNQTKERTFFQHAGANAYYGEDDIDWDKLDVDIFHIGYILLLPHLDEPGRGIRHEDGAAPAPGAEGRDEDVHRRRLRGGRALCAARDPGAQIHRLLHHQRA